MLDLADKDVNMVITNTLKELKNLIYKEAQ